ncbi:TetR/AcrR family transcriptional regulator [Govanella unica]|uniref:TetR/AcrR family transcriptional regulator n=1 Tax=Govanella unica TaxID=2975056 RepID=A0A9X3TY69_9PROT|nr:TetR/AcrR family transcriptional regulator [Govania unica]MDA5193904.1 TetR/AcrR family transcriptional regulator [Govania unica]
MKCKPTSQERGEARKLQVLDAAEDCFLRFGFHGASMAEISRVASMSAGHIYNYFENKEAIINALVERKVAETLAFMDEIEHEKDIGRVMLSHIGDGLTEKLDSKSSALMLEVVAEASRNPKMAELLYERDRILRARLRSLIMLSREQRGVEVNEDIDGAVEVVIALFEGLGIRGIANPGLDRAAVLRLMERIIHRVFNG